MDHNTSYISPPAGKVPAKQLVVDPGGPDEQRYTFFDVIEIRRQKGRAEPGVVFIDDPGVSARHCVISQMRDGRCFVRDMSRNGTRLEGRRLVPNVEEEVRVGEELLVGQQIVFRLEGDPSAVQGDSPEPTHEVTGTLEYVERPTVTVLVGDIRGYTALVQEAPPTELQASVNRLFERLDREVVRYGGTVKEHQGDALFAFWEQVERAGSQAAAACRAALGLNRLVEELAEDRGVWVLEDFPLGMEWALATGSVAIHSFGGDHPSGLSVIGRPVVLAFRMEKLANEESGPIVACPVTRDACADSFVFDDLGEMHAEGFATPARLFALRGPR